MSDPRMFRFDTLDRTGVFLGLGVGQLGVLAAGALASTAALTAGVALPIAAVPAVATAVGALGRVRGERLIDLIPVTVGWAARRRRHRWLAPLDLCHPDADPARQPAMPPCLTGLALLEAPQGWGRLAGAGIVHDTTTGEMSAVVRVGAQGFALAERDEQVRLLAGWGDVLAGFATERGLVARLTWSDFATPTGMGDHHAWLNRQPRPTGAAADSYRNLLRTAGTVAAGHDVTVTVTVTAARLGHTRGGEDPEVRLASGLAKATEALLRALRTAGLQAEDPLTPTEVAAVLRTRIDPTPHAASTARSGPLAERLGAVAPANAGPLAVDATWTEVRTDGGLHRCYWIAEWPRLQQHPDWMEPVLAFAGAGTRAITVIFEPVAPSVSRRTVDRDSIKLETDAAAREDKGRRVGAHHRRLQQAVSEREAELVAGYAEIAYAGIVTVTADTLDTLTERCAEMEQAARQHGLELRALHGRHDQAWAAGLPLGLGLARLWIP